MSVNFSVADVVARIEGLPPGRYTLRQLFGEDWIWNRRPQHLGRLFKAAVLRDEVPGVRWVQIRSNKSQEYEVSCAD